MTIRYHPLLVALHWLLALLILGQLAYGALVVSELADNDAAKPDAIRLHMIFGLTILTLMIVRLLTRLTTARPPQPHRAKALRTLARVNHWLFYAVIFAMLVTGLGMAQLGGLFPLLEGRTVPIPDLHALPPHDGHELFATVLLALLALHIAGVIYHYTRGERLLSRMAFGARREKAEGDGWD